MPPPQSPWAPEHLLAAGGGWRLDRLLGGGAMAWVYLCRPNDQPAAEPAAVKVLRPGLDSPELRRRFERERIILELVAELQPRYPWPLAPRVLAAGEIAARHPATDQTLTLPFFAMSCIGGGDIAQWLAVPPRAPMQCSSEGAAPAPQVAAEALAQRVTRSVQVVQQLAAILAALHAGGIAHGDVKPENVLMNAAGRPVLIDFGTARVFAPAERAAALRLPSDSGSQICTPQFAAPEQLCGAPPTPAADVYGLAALLYYLLAGRPPHERSGRSLQQYARFVAETAPPPPSALRNGTAWSAAAGTLDAAILTALAPAPAARHRGAADFAAALQLARA